MVIHLIILCNYYVQIKQMNLGVFWHFGILTPFSLYLFAPLEMFVLAQTIYINYYVYSWQYISFRLNNLWMLFIYINLQRFMWKTTFAEASSSSQWCALLYNGSCAIAQQASPYVAKRVYSLIRDSGFSCFWYYRGVWLYASTVHVSCEKLAINI